MLPKLLLPLSCALLLFACSPAIGDPCETVLDCSSQASRVCDRTQPSGYCTIAGCERGTCPEDSVCVKFHPFQGSVEGEAPIQQERLASTFCMAKCDGDGDCREGDGYTCTGENDFGQEGRMEAEVLDNPDQRFCSALREMPSP
jgi:hypothetical protein